MNSKNVGELLIRRVREYVQPVLDQLADRISETKAAVLAEMDRRLSEVKSVTPEDIRPTIDLLVAKAFADRPAPKDGKSVTIDEVLPAITAVISQVATEAAQTAVADIPIPKDGVSVTVEDLFPQCQKLVAEAVAAIPRPKDGTSVSAEQIIPTLTAELQKAIEALPIPKDGESVKIEDFRQMFEAEQAKWALEFERRAHDGFQRAIDRMPKAKDGIDGLGFDDMEVSYDGERTFTLRFTRGEQLKEFAFKVPALIERGVYKDGTAYERGDGVTWGGSYWIALKDTTSKPGEANADWRLAVKSGRQGKSAFDIARSTGFSGSEREWIDSLKGRPGRDVRPANGAAR